MATVSSKWVSSALEGSRVLLRMRDGDIEGVVAGVCEKTSRVSMREVVVVDTREKLLGQIHCHAKDIASCIVLENSKHKKYILAQDEDGPRLLRVRTIPPHLERLNASVNSCEIICHRMDGDTSDPIKKGSIKLMGSPEDLPKLKQPIATEFEVVDKVNDQLSEAIVAMKNEQSISVGYEGTKVGRHGFLSVLMVATSSKVYIFDVFALKKELFSHGLKEILESKDIEKVIHGCRYLSDCLFHQYQVSLDNVFDTMVADIILHHNTSVDAGYYQFPTLVRGIQNCIRTFLKFDYLQMKYTRSRQGDQEEEVSTWKQRPFSLRQIDALAKDVVFLKELAQACLGQMLKKFHSGVNFFLSLDRDCTERELGYLPAAHILPRGFADAIKSSTSRSEQQWRRYTDHDRNREDRRYGGKENNRFHERNMKHGPLRMNADGTQFREPREAPYKGGYIWRKGEFSEEGTCKEDSLFYIGMQQRVKENSVPRDTAAPIPNGTCNSNESQGKSPGNKENRDSDAIETAVDITVSEPLANGHKHASDSEPLMQRCTEVAVEAVNGKRAQDFNGDQHNIADIQHEPFQRSRPLSPCLQRPQPSSVPDENAAVFARNRDSNTVEATVDIQRCHSVWGNRPIDTTAETYSFRPADFTVQKHSS